MVDQFYLISEEDLSLSWAFIVKFQESLLERSLIFISFCPFRRQRARAHGISRVLNPYEWRACGNVERPVVWWDQWPSFMANKYEPLRHHFRGTAGTHIFYQSFRLKNQSLLLKESFGESCVTYLYKGKVPLIPIVPSRFLILSRHEGEARRGLLLKDPRRWPNLEGKEIFIPLCLWRDSSCLALAGRHRILLISAESLASWRHWCLWETLLTWLLSGQLQPDLLRWWGENKNRGYPHPKDSFSRKARDWHASIKEWSFRICSFLWGSRGRKEA
ncbi:MAG: hypothetical protein K9K67_00270 [Bacteriovoracaceae bacterium]|nr:hypothetical protein [Bacteriovoracaceae bacterium]